MELGPVLEVIVDQAIAGGETFTGGRMFRNMGELTDISCTTYHARDYIFYLCV